jgi:hypothetical protein
VDTLSAIIITAIVAATVALVVVRVNSRGRATVGNGIAIAIVFVGLVFAGIAVYYFAVYDTAQGRCSRGELGACGVVLRVLPPEPAATVAGVDPGTAAGVGGCFLGIKDHDMVAIVSSAAGTATGNEALCSIVSGMTAPLGGTWLQLDAMPAGLGVVCQRTNDAGDTVLVEDDGARAYGSALCGALPAPGWH